MVNSPAVASAATTADVPSVVIFLSINVLFFEGGRRNKDTKWKRGTYLLLLGDTGGKLAR